MGVPIKEVGYVPFSEKIFKGENSISLDRVSNLDHGCNNLYKHP